MQLLLTLFLVAAVLVGVLHSHNIIPKRADVALAELQDEAYVISIAALPAPEDEVGVVAFSLFGNDRKYTYGAVKNAELAKLYYPGWVVRFYGELLPCLIRCLSFCAGGACVHRCERHSRCCAAALHLHAPN